jgi:hypothetical protein
MSAVAADSLIGTMVGHAIVDPSATDKEKEAKAKEAGGHKKAVK